MESLQRTALQHERSIYRAGACQWNLAILPGRPAVSRAHDFTENAVALAEFRSNLRSVVNATAKNPSGGNSRRKTVIIVGAVLLFLVLAVGGWTYFRGKATPENSQRALWKYLRKQAGTKEFKPDLDLAAASLSSNATRPVTVTTTNKTGKVRTITRMVKTTGKAAVGVIPETSFSDYF